MVLTCQPYAQCTGANRCWRKRCCLCILKMSNVPNMELKNDGKIRSKWICMKRAFLTREEGTYNIKTSGAAWLIVTQRRNRWTLVRLSLLNSTKKRQWQDGKKKKSRLMPQGTELIAWNAQSAVRNDKKKNSAKQVVKKTTAQIKTANQKGWSAGKTFRHQSVTAHMISCSRVWLTEKSLGRD